MAERISTNVNPVATDDDLYDPLDAWWAGDSDEISDDDAKKVLAIMATIAQPEVKFNPAEARKPKGTHEGGEWGVGGFAATLHAAVKNKAPAGSSKTATDPKVSGLHFALSKEKPGSSGNFEKDANRVKSRLQHYYAAGSDTETLYDNVKGAPQAYTLARTRQQRKVVDHFLNAPGVKSQRRFVMLGGLPGSGKTTFLNSEAGKKALPGFTPKEYVNVNPDDVKDYMATNGMAPNYPGLSKGEAVGLYHEEASMLAKKILDMAAAQGKNIVYDVTLKNAAQGEHATSVLDKYGDKYHRTAVFIDVPTELAAQRAQYRYQHGEGRFVPIENIQMQKDPTGKHHSVNRGAFEAIKGTMDHWVTVDNTNPDGKGPKIIGEGGSAPK